MANTRELRRRIKSIKNTSQITKAMQMVAATKMRKAQNQATSGRPYSENLMLSLSKLLPQIRSKSHPLLQENDSKTVGVILFSTDKGLVGALNTNLFRLTLASRLPGGNVNFYTVGKKGRSFVAKSGKDLKADFENSDVVTFRQAKQLAKMIIAEFLQKNIGEAFIVYPRFVSTIKQEAITAKLLPINVEDITNQSRSSLQGEAKVTSGSHLGGLASKQEFLIEPNASELLEELLNHFIEIQIYQSLLETKASEHSARMITMQNATDNAKELVSDLTLAYNQTRQAGITTELLEITTAQVAMQ